MLNDRFHIRKYGNPRWRHSSFQDVFTYEPGFNMLFWWAVICLIFAIAGCEGY